MASIVRPLTALLWAAVTLPLLSAALYTGTSYFDRLAEAKDDLAHEAIILREHALRVFEAQLAAIAYIDARTEGMSWDQIRESAPLHATLRNVAATSPHIDGIWLIPPDGRTANTSEFFPVPPETDASARSYFNALKERDVTHLGEMIRGYLKGNLKFSLSRRRSGNDGSFNGLILITGDIDYFNDFWERALKPGQIGAILRSDGEILARHPKPANLPPKIAPDSPFFSYAQNETTFLYQHVSQVDGADRIYAFEKLGTFPAFIGVGADRAVLLGAWGRRSAVVGVIAVALSGLLCLLVVVARRYQENMEREIGLRQGAEHELLAKEEQVAALVAAEARVRVSEERFRALFETSTQGVIHLDCRGTIISANPTAQQLLGFSDGEMMARLKERGLEIIDENLSPVPPSELPAAIAVRRGEVLKNFVMGLRRGPEGTVRWFTIDAVPQRRPGDSNPWSVFLLLTENTEQRRAAQLEKVLLAEVDHRAKNMLALVLSIVRLTKADSPERLMETLEGRIRALAGAHSLLSRGRWSDVDLRELVDDILAPYRQGAGCHRLSIRGPTIRLKASATQSLVLMLHELATNAAKYGALSVPQGYIDLSWEIKRDDQVLRLRWKERDGPAVVEPDRLSFGSRLIRLSIEGDLGGRVQKAWRTEGLEATVDIPLRHMSSLLQNDESQRMRASDPITVAPEICRSIRVLVVEDNPIIAAELAEQLRALGCVVDDVAHTLEQAKIMIEANQPDAAILDVDIRGQRVFPLAEELRARRIPIAFCTGFSGLSEIEAEWPDAIVLQKPVFSAELGRAVQRLAANPAPHSSHAEQGK